MLKTPVNTAFLYEWGSRGREFESLHPDQRKSRKRRVFGAFAMVVYLLENGVQNAEMPVNTGKFHSIANTTANYFKAAMIFLNASSSADW